MSELRAIIPEVEAQVLPGKDVLVIDDDASLGGLIADILARNGHRVQVAGKGALGIKTL